MSEKIYKLPNAQIIPTEPNAELIAVLEEALAHAKSGEAICGGISLVLQRTDGIYYYTTYASIPGKSSELFFAIARLKARFERAIDLDGSDD